jgi:hypothetical protein
MLNLQEFKEDILRRAKKIFMKRTKHLLLWISPELTRKQRDTVVTDSSWDTIDENLKMSYILEVRYQSVP